MAEFDRKGQKHVWSKMNKVERDREIVNNKHKCPGRGHKFSVELTEKVWASV